MQRNEFVFGNNTDEFCFRPVSSNEIRKIVISFPSNKAPGTYMSNTDNLYPIDKSTLPSVRFDPSVSCYLRSDSCYLRLDNILQLVQCRAMQEVAPPALLVSALARTCCACAWSVRWSDRSIGSIGQSCLRSDNFLPMDIF